MVRSKKKDLAVAIWITIFTTIFIVSSLANFTLAALSPEVPYPMTIWGLPLIISGLGLAGIVFANLVDNWDAIEG